MVSDLCNCNDIMCLNSDKKYPTFVEYCEIAKVNVIHLKTSYCYIIIMSFIRKLKFQDDVNIRILPNLHDFKGRNARNTMKRQFRCAVPCMRCCDIQT